MISLLLLNVAGALSTTSEATVDLEGLVISDLVKNFSASIDLESLLDNLITRRGISLDFTGIFHYPNLPAVALTSKFYPRTAGNILILEMTLETVSALTGVNGTAFMSFNHTFDPPVVVPILGTADSGTIDNVLMVQGTINSLNIIPLGELDILDMNITTRIGSLGGVGGIPLPFNGLTQSDVPTTYSLQTISV
ncbi:MAG: hypothetical protein NXY57DRAFT_960426 [Lentinula lateritia]|uniref:Uncharacterized protein n=1 Tax=Lentinula lateritia TaxID=40482 RepID=A0ABQ8V5F7_9AGAR|nr:hypothetical protein EV359DRAFT_78569 [Lentinula novae-zelandiae]KAJ3932920.1 MAG: hypothetical protein NXY57DRAFT_960426 [Lentinula lateritia]KAJ4474171.1 hypothetical protein C8R41DRAFT_923935 [Lentinula lateritia]